jgi:hypothetical protein
VTALFASVLHVVLSCSSRVRHLHGRRVSWWLFTHLYLRSAPGISWCIDRRAQNRSAWGVPRLTLLRCLLDWLSANLLSQMIFSLAILT